VSVAINCTKMREKNAKLSVVARVMVSIEQVITQILIGNVYNKSGIFVK